MSANGRVWSVVFWTKVLMALVVTAALWAQFNLGQFHNAFASWPPGGNATLASRFSTWDVAHYLRLSESGYKAGSKSRAFYPLWPAAIRVATVLAGGRPVLAAMLLTNALSLLAFRMLYRLVERHCGPEVSRDSLIGILAALLLPALGRARAAAQGAQCASDLRQLRQAWTMYSDDSNGQLPCNTDGQDGMGVFTNWVAGTMSRANDATNTHLLIDPSESSLSRYIPSPGIYARH